jgi:hypothetical protein
MCSSPILELERTGQWGIVTGYPLFASLFVVFVVVTRLRVLTFEEDGCMRLAYGGRCEEEQGMSRREV